jgi:hypothetical protein
MEKKGEEGFWFHNDDTEYQIWGCICLCVLCSIQMSTLLDHAKYVIFLLSVQMFNFFPHFHNFRGFLYHSIRA